MQGNARFRNQMRCRRKARSAFHLQRRRQVGLVIFRSLARFVEGPVPRKNGSLRCARSARRTASKATGTGSRVGFRLAAGARAAAAGSDLRKRSSSLRVRLRFIPIGASLSLCCRGSNRCAAILSACFTCPAVLSESRCYSVQYAAAASEAKSEMVQLPNCDFLGLRAMPQSTINKTHTPHCAAQLIPHTTQDKMTTQTNE